MTKDPICGMTLEPKTLTAGVDDEGNAELREMTKRFWIGAAMSLSSVSVISNALRLRKARLRSCCET
jgi:cation transport ATPase